jgi:hypothetical protein
MSLRCLLERFELCLQVRDLITEQGTLSGAAISAAQAIETPVPAIGFPGGAESRRCEPARLDEERKDRRRPGTSSRRLLRSHAWRRRQRQWCWSLAAERCARAFVEPNRGRLGRTRVRRLQRHPTIRRAGHPIEPCTIEPCFDIASQESQGPSGPPRRRQGIRPDLAASYTHDRETPRRSATSVGLRRSASK